MNKRNKPQPIWGPRIKNKTSQIFEKYWSSIDVHKRLYKEDIEASIVNVEMLLCKK